MYCVEFREVGKSFRQKDIGSQSFWGKLTSPRLWRESSLEVLKSVNFTVQPGEKIALLGPNGAGKSTLLRLIAGILTPTRGQVKVSGTVAPLLQMGVGFHCELTGRENVFLSCSLFGLTRQQTERLYPEIVDFAELEDFMDRPVKHYSCGMRARLGFAVSTSLDADLYLLDEGLNAGDAAFKEKCQDRINQLLQREKTWIISTHSLKELDQHCTRAFLLDCGRLTIQESLEQAMISYRQICLERRDSVLRQTRLEEDSIWLNGSRRIQRQDGHCSGQITRVLLEESGPVLVGWAFDEQARRPAEEVIAFADGHCLARVPVQEERAAVARSLQTNHFALGFRVCLSKDWLPAQILSGVRLFALSAGTATELLLEAPVATQVSRPAVLAVTHWKAGSQWIAHILKECAPERYVEAARAKASLLEHGAQPGQIYAPIYFTRSRLETVLPDFEHRVFFVMRDLRDSLISLYFSLRYSHDLMNDAMRAQRERLLSEDKESGMLFLIEQCLQPIASIQRSWLDSSVPIFHYEAILQDPFGQLRRILDYCQISACDQHLRNVLERNSFQARTGRMPGTEVAEEHCRKGVAGDWRNHFTPRLVEAFKAAYGEVLIATGYEKNAGWNLEEWSGAAL